jgi:hypothetical protein
MRRISVKNHRYDGCNVEFCRCAWPLEKKLNSGAAASKENRGVLRKRHEDRDLWRRFGAAVAQTWSEKRSCPNFSLPVPLTSPPLPLLYCPFPSPSVLFPFPSLPLSNPSLPLPSPPIPCWQGSASITPEKF